MTATTMTTATATTSTTVTMARLTTALRFLGNLALALVTVVLLGQSR